MQRPAILVSAVALFVFAPEAGAHGGGLNAEGCHRERATGGYHCHRASAPSPPRPVPRSTSAFMGSGYYANCAAARAAGAAPLRRGEVGYRPELDRDGDGVACETTGSSEPRRAAVMVGVPAAAVGVMGAVSRTDVASAPIVGTAIALDGDTLTIGGQKIRLFGVDAFEAEQRCSGSSGRSWGCGGVATRALQALVNDETTVCFARERDAYDRTVAMCRSGGTDLAAAMVVRGLAVAYARYSGDYDAEQTLAKTNRNGAWAGTFVEPEAFRRSGQGSASARAARLVPEVGSCSVKGNISGGGRKLYHLPGDPSYDAVQPEAVFCSDEEALAAGFARPHGF